MRAVLAWFDRRSGGFVSVITLDSFAPVPEPLRGAFLAVGTFDGVHLGHAHLIARLRALANLHRAPVVAVTFDPRPAEILRPQAVPPPLSWPARRFQLLGEVGATEVAVFRTGPWLLGLTAREFFDRVVIGQFAARGMVEGPTFGFGRDRGGDARILGDWCAECGLAFEIASPVERDGQIVSSSRIRAALAEGQVAEAADLLGRPHRLRGGVTKGAGRGAGLGFPTANLDGIAAQIPADGVYAAVAEITGKNHAAAVHIGANATFDATARTVEVHLLDFQGDLYGRTLEIDLLDRLRGSQKFAGVEELLHQIAQDVAQTRKVAALTDRERRE